nr:fatty acyl-CoA reductase wat-like [Vanessa tameamea]
MIWTYHVTVTKSLFMFNIYVMALHTIPAIFVDLLLTIFGKKPMLLKIQRRVYVSNLALQYFLIQQWTFSNTNLIYLRSKIKEEDREEFYYEIEKIDKYEFFKKSCAAGRKYLLKEKDENLPKARIHHQRIRFLDKLLKFIFYGLIFWWLINTNFIKNLFVS